MAKSNLRLVSPASGNRTVTPLRRPNSALRPREHLTEREVEKLIDAAKRNRWGQRDATMILIAFRHGLRASELCGLQWRTRTCCATLAATPWLIGEPIRGRCKPTWGTAAFNQRCAALN